MLCDKCQIREATVHCTMCNSNAVEEPKHIDFCQECFESSGLPDVHTLPTDIDIQASILAGCRYCGGAFYTAGLDPLTPLGGVRKMRVMCEPCAKEYFGFLRLKFPGFGDGDPTKKQTAALAAQIKARDFQTVLAELDVHMKQWVAKRKSQ